MGLDLRLYRLPLYISIISKQNVQNRLMRVLESAFGRGTGVCASESLGSGGRFQMVEG